MTWPERLPCMRSPSRGRRTGGGALLEAIARNFLAALLRFCLSYGRQPLLQLLPHLLGIRRLGLQRQRLLPLEARLALAPYAPVRIAQVIVERGVLGPQLDGLLEV